jgi:hypothetical protein
MFTAKGRFADRPLRAASVDPRLGPWEKRRGGPEIRVVEQVKGRGQTSPLPGATTAGPGSALFLEQLSGLILREDNHHVLANERLTAFQVARQP